MAANLPASSRVKQEPMEEPDYCFTFNTPSNDRSSTSNPGPSSYRSRLQDSEETEFQIPPRFSSSLRGGDTNQPSSPPVRFQNDSGTVPAVSSRIQIPSTSRARITAPDEDPVPLKKRANKRQNPAAVIMEAEPIRKQKKNAQKNKKNRGLCSVEPLDLLELPPESEEIIYSYDDDPSFCQTGPAPIQLSAEDLRSLLQGSEQRLEKKLMAHIVNNIKQNRMQQTVEMLKEIDEVKIFVKNRLDRNDLVQEEILAKIDNMMEKMRNFAGPDVDFVHVGPDHRERIVRRPELQDDYHQKELPRSCSETSQPFSPSTVSSDSIVESIWSEGIDENEEQDFPVVLRQPDLRQEYREEKTAPWRRSTPKDPRHQSHAAKSSEHPDNADRCRRPSSTSGQQRHNHADSTETRRKEQVPMTNDHPHAIESDVSNSGSRRTEISASSSDDQQYAKQAQDEVAEEIEDGEIVDGCQEFTMETSRNSKITPISWP